MVTGDSAWANRVEITDRDGWRKEFPLERPLLYLGSDPRNDVVLEAQRGGEVAPRHLQLIALPAQVGGGYRAINLSDWNIPIGQEGGRSLAPRAAVEIVDGDTLRVGDFYLVFHLGAATAGVSALAPHAAAPVARPPARDRQEPEPVPVVRSAAGYQRAISAAAAGQTEFVGVEDRSAHMGLKLSLPQARVAPDLPLEGTILLRNLGAEQAVQFRIEIEGLHPDWYQVGPAPILFPNVEKGVALRVQHPRGPAIAAGRHEIQVRASAPDAYPGEEVTVRHDVDIVPYYHHTLALTVLD